MTGDRARTRMTGLLLIAAGLASGVAGRGPAMADTAGDRADGLASLDAPGRARARLSGPGEPWRPSVQDGSTECDVRGVVESPAEGATLGAGPLTIGGWASDVAAAEGTGVTEVRIALDADPNQGGVPVGAPYGLERPDIAQQLGEERFNPFARVASPAQPACPGRPGSRMAAPIPVTRTVAHPARSPACLESVEAASR